MRVVILATSAKHKGFCVAGLDLDTNRLVRLVSDDASTHFAMELRDISYANGQQCKPLDIVTVNTVRYKPLETQIENFEVNCRIRPVLRFESRLDGDIYKFFYTRGVIEDKNSLFLGSQRHFLNEYEIKRYGGKSLALYLARGVYIYKNDYGKAKAIVLIGTNLYENISVTDQKFFGVTKVKFTNSFLLVSLPDVPFSDGKYYKFIANIMRTQYSITMKC